jgi:hypothetical protein
MVLARPALSAAVALFAGMLTVRLLACGFPVRLQFALKYKRVHVAESEPAERYDEPTPASYQLPATRVDLVPLALEIMSLASTPLGREADRWVVRTISLETIAHPLGNDPSALANALADELIEVMRELVIR